jgi:hypothetical protein
MVTIPRIAKKMCNGCHRTISSEQAGTKISWASRQGKKQEQIKGSIASVLQRNEYGSTLRKRKRKNLDFHTYTKSSNLLDLPIQTAIGSFFFTAFLTPCCILFKK